MLLDAHYDRWQIKDLSIHSIFNKPFLRLIESLQFQCLSTAVSLLDEKDFEKILVNRRVQLLTRQLSEYVDGMTCVLQEREESLCRLIVTYKGLSVCATIRFTGDWRWDGVEIDENEEDDEFKDRLEDIAADLVLGEDKDLLKLMEMLFTKQLVQDWGFDDGFLISDMVVEGVQKGKGYSLRIGLKSRFKITTIGTSHYSRTDYTVKAL